METLELIYFLLQGISEAEGSLDVQLHGGAILTIGAQLRHCQMQSSPDKFWMPGAFDGSDRLDIHAFHSVTMTASGLGTLNCLFFFWVTLVRSFSCTWPQLKLIRKLGKHIYTIIRIPELAAEFCQLETDLDISGKREVLFLFGGHWDRVSLYISSCPETHYEE